MMVNYVADRETRTVPGFGTARCARKVPARPAHIYEHESGRKNDIVQTLLSLAVHLISVGASNIRWLAEIDSA
jgi:hypothetical protein